MRIGSQTTLLRTALQHALDELVRINNLHQCVRPDVTFAASDALLKTFLAPIENASEIEQMIVGKLVTDLLNAGYSLTIFNGGVEPELNRSSDAAVIFAALAASDHDEIVVRQREIRKGWIRLIWGNDCDVISDYTINLETHLAGANALATELEG